jgi:hypothetical protein
VAAEFPEIVQVARANRQFVVRAVAAVAAEGIGQYIDIGAGLPTVPSIHQAAARISPAARVAYVDHDPVVLAHARALLATSPAVTVLAPHQTTFARSTRRQLRRGLTGTLGCADRAPGVAGRGVPLARTGGVRSALGAIRGQE